MTDTPPRYAVYGNATHELLCEGTPAEVILALWGRWDIRQLTFYGGECPYRFFTRDVGWIAAVLERFPPERVRPTLPLWLHHTDHQGERRLGCVIGDRHPDRRP